MGFGGKNGGGLGERVGVVGRTVLGASVGVMVGLTVLGAGVGVLVGLAVMGVSVGKDVGEYAMGVGWDPLRTLCN